MDKHGYAQLLDDLPQWVQRVVVDGSVEGRGQHLVAAQAVLDHGSPQFVGGSGQKGVVVGEPHHPGSAGDGSGQGPVTPSGDEHHRFQSGPFDLLGPPLRLNLGRRLVLLGNGNP